MADKEKIPPERGHPEVATAWSATPEPPDPAPYDYEPDLDEQPDGIFEGESDADDFDEDGTPTEDSLDSADDDARKPSIPGPAGPGALDDSQIYKLSVFSRDDGSMGCEYDAATWHEITRGNPTVDFNVCNRSEFLRACASWLETQKNGFLATRMIEEYLSNETTGDSGVDPVVTARGFLRRVNLLLPPEGCVKEYNFSRILPHIWLIWDEGSSLPLAALFSDTVKILWVIEGCRRAYPDPSIWQKAFEKGIKIKPKNTSTEATSEAFEKQNPTERCRYLFKRVGLRSDEDIKRILEQLAKHG